MPLPCYVTLSRSPSLSGLQMFPCLPYKTANALAAGTGSLSLTLSQEPHKQPSQAAVYHCPHLHDALVPSSPGFYDQPRGAAWGLGWGRGRGRGPRGDHWFIQSLLLPDQLSRTSDHSFIQQTFTESQDKRSLGPRSIAHCHVPYGRTGTIWLIKGNLGEDLGAEGPSRILESRPSARARLTGPGPASP